MTALATPPKVQAISFALPLVGELSSGAALLVIDLQRDFTEPGGYMDGMGYDIAPLAAPLPSVARVLDATNCADTGVGKLDSGGAQAAVSTARPPATWDDFSGARDGRVPVLGPGRIQLQRESE
mmetsp:Transcript_32291/g.99554  ORF Transcript_32291/g.99554 Transcript_32291/m.99554 type:complete len:124 (+) Transcript_32291:326-697(+)